MKLLRDRTAMADDYRGCRQGCRCEPMAKKPVHAAILKMFWFIGVWICALEAWGAEQAVPQPLTSAFAVHSLGADEAGRRLPVLLRCVVTFTDPVRSMLFVRDASGGVYVDINAP